MSTSPVTKITVEPGDLVAYRTAVAALDGTTKPAANSALWAANPGQDKAKCRVFVTTGGTAQPTTLTLRAYVRSGGTTGQVGSLSTAVTAAGTPNFDATFDVQTDGDDIAVLIETLSGGTAPTVTIKLSWR